MLKLKKTDIYNTIIKVLYSARPTVSRNDIYIIDTHIENIWISLHGGADVIKINKVDFPFSLEYLRESGIKVSPAENKLIPFLFSTEDSAEDVIFKSVGYFDKYGNESLCGTLSDGTKVWINKAYRDQFTPSAQFKASGWNKPVFVYEFDTGARIGVIMPINHKYEEAIA